MADAQSLRTSISRVSSFQHPPNSTTIIPKPLPVQSQPVCKPSHFPGLYHHNHRNGIRKTATAAGHFTFVKIIEKQCAILCLFFFFLFCFVLYCFLWRVRLGYDCSWAKP